MRDDAPARLSTGPTRSFPMARSILALMLREMSTRYGRTPGGYVWAILEPLGAILVLALGFSLVLRSPSLGNSFILFYATGFLPFNIFNDISNNVARSLKFSKGLLVYPSVTWIDALLARFVLNLLTGLLISYLLLGGILMLSETRSVLQIGPIIEAMCLTALLGLGVGSMNCVLGGLFPVWDNIWSIITRPLFLASGVFFIYDDMPPLAKEVLWYNPLIHITGLMREGFYPMYAPGYISIAYVTLVSMALLVLGLLLLGKHHKDIINA
ncbi:ABC transporter permease [Litorisediminicola beolgyonensis]|uniref:Transport permease protein n=1 Tax=Litorisediminicola beolgyonensis TaxID=1173614 RepID=A0ABW3ZP93_9RHOB